MTTDPERPARLPPRWVMRAFWAGHRALYALTGGRVASCGFDLDIQGTQSEAEGTVLTMEGTACGRQISTGHTGDGPQT